jgi:hypothetical protein
MKAWHCSLMVSPLRRLYFASSGLSSARYPFPSGRVHAPRLPVGDHHDAWVSVSWCRICPDSFSPPDRELRQLVLDLSRTETKCSDDRASTWNWNHVVSVSHRRTVFHGPLLENGNFAAATLARGTSPRNAPTRRGCRWALQINSRFGVTTIIMVRSKGNPRPRATSRTFDMCRRFLTRSTARTTMPIG